MATVKNAEETPAEKPPRKQKPGPGRPRADQVEPVREAKQNRFFEIIANIPSEEWGTRVSLWLYRLEPYTDRRRSGDHIYLMQYTTPVDEQRVMADFGSGRYRLMLTFRKPSGEGNDQRDRYEFEINNPAYPPKIPAGEWVDDVRNNKWAWAKPMLTTPPNGTTPPPPGPQPPDMLEALETLDRIQDRAAERLKAATPAPTEVKPAADPIDQAVKIMSLMKGGGETALLQMMSDQMKDERARNERLETELRKRANEPPPPPVDPLAAMAAQFEQMKRLKELFEPPKEENPSALEEGLTKLARSKMSGWMEFLQPAVPELLKAVQPLTAALAQKLMQPQANIQRSPAPPTSPQSISPPIEINPAVNGQPPQPQTPPTPEQIEAQDMLRFVLEITPKMIEYVMTDQPGDTFAQLLADYHSAERVTKLQKPEPEHMVQFFKTTTAWDALKNREAQLLTFWKEFKEWKPELSDGMDEDVKEKIG